MRRLLVPLLLPPAASWVARQERRILAVGDPLSPAQLEDARHLGVAEPERVRVLAIPIVPLPADWMVRIGRLFAGASFQDTAGLAARYGIFLKERYAHVRELLAHELTHTRQYERLGGIRPFLRQYLRECLSDGYLAAGLEIEAREAASSLCFP